MNILESEAGVVALMESSESEQEWDANCAKVKAANRGDYPLFWYRAIYLSGVFSRARTAWRAQHDNGEGARAARATEKGT